MRIGPSVLSADFLTYGNQLQDLTSAGADYIHFDVMDGVFVPNISIGLPILEATRRGTDLPIDAHLMIVHPDQWVEAFCDAGADSVTFHVEATAHAHRVVQTIREKGKLAGVALNPATPLSMVQELLPFLDHVLIMTVNPGFGGQSYISEMTAKVSTLRGEIEARGFDVEIQVDGGINAQTIGQVYEAGAKSFVAGSSVFAPPSLKHNIDALRQAVASV